MSDPDDEVQCPMCQMAFRRRDLHSEVVMEQSCRYCKAVLERQSHFEYRNEPAIIEDDVACIAAWLDDVAQAQSLEVRPGRDREGLGEYLWTVLGLPFSWQCEALYERGTSGVVTVRLRTSTLIDKFLGDPVGMQALAATQGVQLGGRRGAENWWCAQELFLTSRLRPALFRPVVDRLDATMQAIVARLSAD